MIHRLRFFSFLGLVAILLVTAVDAKRPETRERVEIDAQYRWDFAKIYPNWEAWEADLEKFHELVDAYAALEGTLSEGPHAVLDAYRLSDEVGILSYKLYRYPQLQRDVDLRDNTIQARFQTVQSAFTKLSQATSWFSPELLEIPEATMQEWLDTTPGLEPYRFPIEDLYRQQAHVLPAEQEKLLSYFGNFSSSPRDTFSALSTADITFPDVTFGDGEEQTLSPGSYSRALRTMRDQEDRRLAFEEFYGIYAANQNTYAAIYNGILQRGWGYAQARGYDSVLDSALSDDNIPEAVFLNLLETVKASTEPMQRYHRLRQEWLGLENYHLYDTSIPIVEDDTEYYFEDAVPMIIDSVELFGADYQAKMESLFGNRLLDVYENDGKRPGAYMAGVYGVSPYVLLNYNDTLDSVFTLAHEMGHAVHTVLSNENQPFATANYTIFVAEVAAILNEKLFLEVLLEEVESPSQRFALIEQQIEGILGTFYTQVMFANFELAAHSAAEAGEPITAESLSVIYSDLMEAYYGDAVTHAELYRYVWTRIPHFYHSPYYVYQYATCFASAAWIYKQIQAEDPADRQAAIDRYLTLLSSGGNDYPMEQLRKAGVDLSQPEPVEAVVAELDRLVDLLEAAYAEIEAGS